MALRDVSITFNAGESVAIVGRTGRLDKNRILDLDLD
jgi:ABC-type polysaccharide/polyol phosphate transport system ATPase subunit